MQEIAPDLRVSKAKKPVPHPISKMVFPTSPFCEMKSSNTWLLAVKPFDLDLQQRSWGRSSNVSAIPFSLPGTDDMFSIRVLLAEPPGNQNNHICFRG